MVPSSRVLVSHLATLAAVVICTLLAKHCSWLGTVLTQLHGMLCGVFVSMCL